MEPTATPRADEVKDCPCCKATACVEVVSSTATAVNTRCRSCNSSWMSGISHKQPAH